MLERLLRHIFEPEEREQTMKAILVFVVIGGVAVSAMGIIAIVTR